MEDSNKSTLSNKALKTLIIFSSIVAAIGAIIIVPFTKEPSFALFIWFSVILISDLIAVVSIFKNVKITTLSVSFIVSYLLLTLGFIINTKMHLTSVFLLFALIPLINVSLISNILYSNFITRGIWAALYFTASKFTDIFVFLGNLFSVFKTTSQNSFSKKLKTSLAITALFLVTGFPVIIIALALLSSSNAQFSTWIGDFLRNISIETIILKVIFFLFIAAYFVTEIYYLVQIKKNEKRILDNKVGFSEGIARIITLTGVLTLTIINFFYILFIIADYYINNNLKQLVTDKSLDSYSVLAVGRFWELIIICILNLGIIYLLRKPFKKYAKTGNKFVSYAFLINSLVLFVVTLFLIYTTHTRLSFYEFGYGFTGKRLLAHAFLPVLVVVTVLVFSGFVFKKYSQKIRYAISLIFVFFALWIALPTDYITGKLNLELLKSGNNKIQVFDPTYTIRNSKSDFVGDYKFSSRYENDIESYDGYLVALELLNAKPDLLTKEQRNLLKNRLEDYKYQPRGITWREFNVMRILLEKELNDKEF